MKRLGDHEQAAEYYKKTAMNIGTAKRLGTLGYTGAAAVASKILLNNVKNGKITKDQALKVGKYAKVGKQIADIALNTIASSSWENYRKEYWKPNR